MAGVVKTWAFVSVSLGILVGNSNAGGPAPSTSAPAPQAGLAGAPGQATRHDSVTWDELGQGATVSPAAPSRVQRVNGRWTRRPTEPPVPNGALSTADRSTLTTEPESDALFALAGSTPPSPAAGLSFSAALDDGTRFNPDTQGAVGPNHLMVTLSSVVRIQDRLGNNLSSMTLNQFWSGLGTFEVYDPRVLYDRTNQRWIHTAIANPGLTTAGLLLAVSQTSNPLGTWNRHFIGVGNTNSIFPDSPNVGFNKNWITVQANMFDNTNFNFFSSDIWAFNKTNLYNGAAATYRHFRYGLESAGPVNALVPAVTYDDDQGTSYLVADWVGDYSDPVAGPIGLLRIFSISGPVDAPVFNDYGPDGLFVFGSASLYNPPWSDFDPYDENFAPQLGTTNRIFIGDARIQNVVFRNSTLWCTHHVFLPYNAPTRSAVQWFAFTPGGTVLQRGRVDDASGAKFFAYPSLAVNQAEDVLLGYSRFAANQYPSANYSFHGYEDFPGTLRGDVVLKAGEGSFAADDRGITRWGDWSATVVDPNDIDLWTLQEYAAAPSGGLDRWGTWWGLVSPSTSLTLTMTASTNRVLATGTITYSLRVTNSQAFPATGVRLTDRLPAGAVFVSAISSKGGCTSSGSVVTCDFGNLDGLSASTATIVARLNDNPSTNTATVISYGPDSTPLDNTVSIITTVDPASDLSVVATDSPDPVALNTTLTYQVGVSNAGPSAAPGVYVTNTLPTGVTFVSAVATPGSCSLNGRIVTCSLGTIINGSSVPVTIRVVPTVAAQLTFTATIASSAQDVTTANNSVSIVTRANAAPTMTPISNQTIAEDGSTGQLPITVSDAESTATSLTLGGFSSAPSIVPANAFLFTGSGNSRFVTVTPAPNANGVVTVYVYVTDTDGTSTTNSFVLTVTAVNDLPTISDIPPQSINEDTTLGPISFTIGDVETAASSLTVSATSSNPNLVPSGNISLTGSGQTRFLTLSPATNLFGTTTITVYVSDGLATSSDTFILNVTAVNDLPTISPIGPRTINEDTGTGAISFTVGDVETTAGSLTLTASSSNPTLVPVSGIGFGGSGGSRTVSVSPAPDQFGTATISVTVNDNTGGSNTTSFVLTVNNVNDPPTLGPIGDLTVNEDSGTHPITLTVVSAGPANENQVPILTATSANPSIIPDPVIDYSSPATTGTLRFTPSLNATGTVQITVTVTDNGTSNNITTRMFNVTVLPVNDPPTISPIANQTIAEDTETPALLFTLSDVDSPIEAASLSGFSSNATLVPVSGITFGGSGGSRTVTVRPAPNQFGTTLISIVASDGQASSTNSFLLQVTGVNDPPTIAPLGAITTLEDVATNVVVIVSDDETDPAALQLSATSGNEGLVPTANLSFTGTGGTRMLQIRPAPNAAGSAVITVRASDGGGLSSTADLLVTVIPVNDTPTLNLIDNITINEDSGLQTVSLTGIGSGALDEVQTLTVTATSLNPSIIPNPTVNYLSPNNSGTLTFTPVANASGQATIQVTVNDGQSSNNLFSRSFTVQVNEVNDPPTINITRNVFLPEDGTTNLVLTILDPDANDTAHSVQVGSSNEELIDSTGLTVSGTGPVRNLMITPLPNQFGSAVISLLVSDGHGGSDTTTINLTVSEVNDVPVISPIADVVTAMNTSTPDIPFTVSDEETFANDLLVSAHSSNTGVVPDSGIALSGTGTDRLIRITPASGQSGSTIITVEAMDIDGGVGSVTFRVRVRGLTEPPTITMIPDQTIDENTTTAAIGFVIGDFETAPDNLSVTASSSNTGLVANASVLLRGTGANRNVTVQPNTNRVGISRITITVVDTDGLDATSTFLVTVRPVDHPPTLTGLNDVTLAEDASTTVNFVVSDDDSGPELLAVTATSSNPSVIPPSGLTLGGTAGTRSLSIQPAANQTGTAVISVTVTDINGTATTGMFQVTVNSFNDLPTITGLMPVTIDEDTASGPLSITVGDAETAATDLNVTVQSQNTTIIPNTGLALSGTGATRTLTVTPAANQFGTANIAVTVSDGSGGSVTSNLVVNVTPVNDAPTLSQPLNLTINEDVGPQVVNLTGISAGPNENQALVITARSSNPALIPNPTVNYSSPAASGTLQFTPVANATGNATITVTISDGQSNNSTLVRTFNVTVTAFNDAPTLSSIAAQQTNEDTPLTVSFVVNDPETPPGALTLTATSTNTTLVATTNILFNGGNSNRTATIIPSPNQFGTSLITIWASDGALSNSTAFLLTVVSVNDPPTLNPIPNFQTNAAGANPSHIVNLSGIGTGATNENQSITITATSSNPSFLPNPVVTYTSPSATGTLTLRPGNNASGASTVTVTVTDNGGGSNTLIRTFLVNVKASANVQPTLSIISNQTINEDGTTGQLQFTPRDAETAATALTVVATSGNPALVPDANIFLGGSGSSRTITVTPLPNASGVAPINMTVVDGAFGASNMTFTVTVNPVNDAPTIDPVPAQTVIEDGTLGPIPVTIGDLETRARDLTLTATSLEPTLIPNANIRLLGTGTERSITLNPATNVSGNCIIQLVVSDGAATATNSFLVAINPDNDLPTISDIPDQTTAEDTPIEGIAILVGDLETAAGALTLSAVSSNPTLVSPGGFNFGGSGSARTLAITPAPDQFGSATITVTVSDGTGTASDTFVLTVTPVNDGPSLNSLSDITAPPGGPPVTVPLSGISFGPANENQSILITASSSNPAVVADPVVNYVSPASNGSLLVRALAGATGSAVITVTANDGQTANFSVVRTFTVTLNQSPTISAIADQTLFEDQAASVVPFTIGDPDTALDQLTVTVSAANPAIFGPTGLSITGTGQNRQLNLAPAPDAYGATPVTVAVEDPAGNRATRTLVATVRPVNDRPTLNPLGPLEIAASSGPTIVNLSGIRSGAANENQFLIVQAVSSQPAILPNPVVLYSSPSETGTLTLTPNGVGGVVTITVTVEDDSFDGGGGSNRVTRTFSVNVTGGGTAPPLRIDLVSGRTVVSWPTNNGAGFVLQSSPALTGQNAAWGTVGISPVVVNGRFTVTNETPPGGSTKFFRLCSGCSGVPRLSIRRDGTDVVLSWPAAGNGAYALQGSDRVGGGTWTIVSGPPAIEGDALTVRMPAVGAPRFFRLCYGCGN